MLFTPALRHLATLAIVSLLSACAQSPIIKLDNGLAVDTSLNAVGQNSRVRQIVLHYTAGDTPTSLKVLSQQDVSSHYLITDDKTPVVYRLVEEDRRAWHAGVSHWGEHRDLNTSSIGIEIVNAGRLADGQWAPYSDAQIETVIRLLQDLVQRHRIPPDNIVGHSDIAPQRKTDPGPLFPWKRLAKAGLGRWYDPQTVAYYQQEFALALPSINTIQQQLAKLGYNVPTHGQWDRATQNVLAAFQMHYRPSVYDGQLDAETAAILAALSQH